jgi:hypothetical protein
LAGDEGDRTIAGMPFPFVPIDTSGLYPPSKGPAILCLPSLKATRKAALSAPAFLFLFEERHMSRHLFGVEHLLQKLQARYGEDDVAVRQVKLELESLEAIESKHQELRTLARECLSRKGHRCSWGASPDAASSTQPPSG